MSIDKAIETLRFNLSMDWIKGKDAATAISVLIEEDAKMVAVLKELIACTTDGDGSRQWSRLGKVIDRATSIIAARGESPCA